MDDGSGWMSTTTQVAYGESDYTSLVHTTADSSDDTEGLLNFRIIASMEEGNWASETSAGYSVDNIAPESPQGLLANSEGFTVGITWDDPADTDINYYKIFRSDLDYFTPSDENLLGYSDGPEFIDNYPLGAEIRYYCVSAVDIHSNEGEPSEILSVVIQSTLIVTYSESWNLVGLPLTVVDPDYELIFPDALSGSLYSYSGTYQSEDIMEMGTGYLLRMTEDSWGVFMGFPNDEVSISLSEGWNLFSGLSAALYPDDLYSYDIVQEGTIYGLDGIYYQPETIEPGNGYWIYAIDSGEITLSSYESIAKQSAPTNYHEGANTLSFSSEAYSQSLYFGVEISQDETLRYGLPPTFPQISFDARFSGETKTVFDSGIIELTNPSETVTIDYDIKIDAGVNMEWALTSESGSRYVLSGQSGVTVPSEHRFSLNRVPVIPETFTLHQNFPNPFNPITTLRYDLPEDALVSLKIYDMLGKEIAHPVNKMERAGFRSVQWDARDSMGRAVSAGVYLYRIEAGKFVQTRKMVLLK